MHLSKSLSFSLSLCFSLSFSLWFDDLNSGPSLIYFILWVLFQIIYIFSHLVEVTWIILRRAPTTVFAVTLNSSGIENKNFNIFSRMFFKHNLKVTEKISALNITYQSWYYILWDFWKFVKSLAALRLSLTLTAAGLRLLRHTERRTVMKHFHTFCVGPTTALGWYVQRSSVKT